MSFILVAEWGCDPVLWHTEQRICVSFFFSALLLKTTTMSSCLITSEGKDTRGFFFFPRGL